MRERTLVVELDPLPAEARRWLSDRCAVVTADDGPETLATALASADALVVRTRTRVDAAMLDKAPHVRVVGRAGTGIDNIDLEACRARGIDVVYRPEANTQAVVEYVVTLICDAMRPHPPLSTAVDASAWERLRFEATAARQMSEQTLGILGMGRIGRRVARVAAALGFEVLFNDLLTIDREEIATSRCVAVEELFAASDVLTIHIDGRESNRGFVGAGLLDRMPRAALLVNTSRGFVVDKPAIAAFLRRRPDTRALLDVHDPEPVPAGDPLLGLPNAVLYPHLASRTVLATREMGWVVRDVVAVLEGRAPEFPVARGLTG